MKQKILVVDDDKRINDLLRDIFTIEGYDVLSAFDGEEAIRMIDENEDIPLMILDVMLPEIDGWDVLDYVKSHFATKIIMLTAITDEYSEAKGLRSGADDYVVNPLREQR